MQNDFRGGVDSRKISESPRSGTNANRWNREQPQDLGLLGIARKSITKLDLNQKTTTVSIHDSVNQRKAHSYAPYPFFLGERIFHGHEVSAPR